MPPSIPGKPLQDCVVVIVGGTTGLGLSGAAACVRAGARAVVVGRNPASASAALDLLGSEARAVVGDAGRPGTAELAIETALEAFGGFHALYHVAGGSGRTLGDGPLHEVTDDGWTRTIEWNLTSAFLSNRAAIRQLLKQGTGGSILNMGSVLGWSPSPGHFATHAYAAAKAGIAGLTRAAAACYAPSGIRLNVIAPAVIETPMALRAASDPEIIEFLATKQPLHGGVGRPEDLDAAVIYFLSDASRCVTGQVLAVDGGWCVSEGIRPSSPAKGGRA